MSSIFLLNSFAKDVEPIRYAVIGDSYSIGEGTTPEKSWPALLTQHLNQQGVSIKLVSNPARTGWTTQQAVHEELPIFVASRPSFATLQIGVNDLVQCVDVETFQNRLALLLDQMQSVLPDKKRLLLVTIPDFSVTPAGAAYSRERNMGDKLMKFNQIIIQEGKKRGLPVVDIFPLSQKMVNNSDLISNDGLHPSAKGYAEWEKLISPVAFDLLKKD
ncbi:MAG: SGNH/GDSL hydrolase family protein [Chthoniobacterales bacterium]